MSGRFRGDLWFDKKVHPRTMHALRTRGITFPKGANPRRQPEYKAEYKRQCGLFRKERAEEKEARKRQRQAEAVHLLAE